MEYINTLHLLISKPSSASKNLHLLQRLTPLPSRLPTIAAGMRSSTLPFRGGIMDRPKSHRDQLVGVGLGIIVSLHKTASVSRFKQNDRDLVLEASASVASGILQLTTIDDTTGLNNSEGRASYAHPVPLWDPVTGNLTDFITTFSFKITPAKSSNCNVYGDGISFFLAPVDAMIPPNSRGGYPGLVSEEHYNDTTKSQIVAVELDTYKNPWDPSSFHLGINIGSVVSIATLLGSPNNGLTGVTLIAYASTTNTLSVFLSFSDDYSSSSLNKTVNLSYIIDLTTVLPENVKVGLSAATGSCYEGHQVSSWNFNSTLQLAETDAPAPATESVIRELASAPESASDVPANVKRNNTDKQVVQHIPGILSGVAVAIFVAAIAVHRFINWRRRRAPNDADSEEDEDFERGTGPKKFPYRELKRATNNFAEEKKLGEGGFGNVYRGLLKNTNTEIAVKRVSKGSRQGKKEFVSEVKIISRLRHRHLVQLLGWCKQQKDLLLVYEYLSNGSLDAHLYGNKPPLPWPVRHKIILGLASALLYLHEEGEQCVLHRDIKPSNIILDSNFNPKLGDFGLARLMDHEADSRTTVVAGTRGYLALECAITGKASKESDIYSFGVVILEIASGKKPLSTNEENELITLAQWVWNLYGRGLLGEVIDPALDGQFDDGELERVAVLGLCCCHPDKTLRPTIRQCVTILNLESPLPTLPLEMPSFVYFAPPMNMSMSTFASSSSYTKSTTTMSFMGDHLQPSTSSGFRSDSPSSSHPEQPFLP